MSKYYILLKSINNAYIWVVTRHQNGIFALVSWDAISRKTALLARRNVGCFLTSEKALHLGIHEKSRDSSTRKVTRGTARGGSVACSLTAHRLCEGYWHTIGTFLPVQLSLLFCWRDQAAAKRAILILSTRSKHRKTCHMLKLAVIIWLKILLVPQGFL